MTALLKTGDIRSIGPRLYTSLVTKEVERALKASWSDIVSQLYPQATLSHRTALEYSLGPQGEIFLTGSTNRIQKYPGLMIQFIRGPKPLDDDLHFLGMRASSLPRALLENLSSTKRTANRSISLVALEERLDSILQVKGEEELNRIRDRAREISLQFKWRQEFKKLDKIIGALLGTRSPKTLSSQKGKARSVGRPYDAFQIERFNLLLSALMQTPDPEVRDENNSSGHHQSKAFFEAYFSNYIEGTTFEIEEAEQIIFQKKIPKERPRDAHDIIGTFQIVGDPSEMNKIPSNFNEFEELIRQRHALLLRARPEVRPGSYKQKMNRAGNTYFTAPELVRGTLEKGFERYLSLPQGLDRAIFVMFLVSEVHPFVDGNGRIARIMMNAELFSQNLTTIIIPTVFREDYLLSLRALSRRDRPQPLIRMLTLAQKISHLKFTPYSTILKYLENHNWFKEPDEAKLIV